MHAAVPAPAAPPESGGAHPPAPPTLAPAPSAGAPRAHWGDVLVAATGLVLAGLWGWRLLAAGLPGGVAAQERLTAAAVVPVACALLAVLARGPGRAHADGRTRLAWRRLSLAFGAWWA